MAYRFRPMLRSQTNAGLAQLTGAAGYGVARAGNAMVNLGTQWDQQDTRDANTAAAQKERKAMQSATRAKNYAANPSMVQKINKQYGVVGDLANDPTAPTVANAAMGRVDLGTPKAKEGFTLKSGEARYDADGKELVKLSKPAATKETKKTVVDKDDFVHVVFKDGTTKNTNIKSKDYWKGKGGSSKDNPFYGYVPAASLDENILANDDLHYDLEKAGILKRDKNEMLYVNKAEYERFKTLGLIDIK